MNGADRIVRAASGATDWLPSMLGGHGRHALMFNELLVLFGVVCAIAYLLVLVFLTVALIRARRSRSGDRSHSVDRSHSADRSHRVDHSHSVETGGERRMRVLLVGWTGFIVIGLVTLTFGSYATDRRMALVERDENALQVTVTGNQWWWDIEYPGRAPAERLRTANELHLPVDRVARITLESNDVIHSFWVPDLAGKHDLVPGRRNEIVLVPTTVGTFRGQCAEFCGVQHARMALQVIVHPQAEFERWYAAQLRPAEPPPTALARAGFDYVTRRECASCHAIAGTPASAQVGPDLTHLASRRTIAAGTFPMTRAHLFAWVADPQSAKPGNRMPNVPLDAVTLNAIVAYLESLR